MSVYPEVPQWWYIVVFILSTIMAFVALTIYVPEAPKWVPPYLPAPNTPTPSIHPLQRKNPHQSLTTSRVH